MQKLKVQARMLQITDVISSGEIVSNVVRAGLDVPVGKVLIYLRKEFPNGQYKVRKAIWGAYTEIGVIRDSHINEGV